MLDEHGIPLDPALKARVARSWGDKEPRKDWVPSCFSTKQSFLLWASSSPAPSGEESGFCTDCTPERKEAMVAQRRCAFTSVTFDHDVDGFVRGNR